VATPNAGCAGNTVMNSHANTSHITDSEAANGGHSCGASPAKWFTSLDDRRIPLPQRVVKVSVLRVSYGMSGAPLHSQPSTRMMAQAVALH